MAHTVIDNKFYVDTAFLNSIGGIPGVSLEHMGFGEFYATTPMGTVDFDRMRGKDFPGQSGRSHQAYDREGYGTKATAWLIDQVESRGKSVRVARDGDDGLRSRLIRLAAAKPELRADLLPLLREDADPASVDQNRPESYYFGKTANDSFEIRWRVEGGSWQVKRFRNGREYEMWVDKMYESKVPFEVDADSVEGHSEEYLRSLLASGLPPRGVQAARRGDENRVVFMVTTAITGPLVVNVTGGIKKKYPYDGTPEGLAATLEDAATSSIRFQSMDFLDGPELNVVKAPRVPPSLARTVFNQTTVIVGPVYVALRGTSMGLEWAILPRAPKFASTRRRA